MVKIYFHLCFVHLIVKIHILESYLNVNNVRICGEKTYSDFYRYISESYISHELILFLYCVHLYRDIIQSNFSIISTAFL